jgi:hypothetical protein
VTLAASDAYRRIRALIVRGRLAPETRVSEAELAARFGISRTPARHAMHRLLAEGLLASAGGGARPRVAVPAVSAEDVEELYQAAGALEGVAARRVGALPAGVRRALAAEMARRERRFRDAARAPGRSISTRCSSATTRCTTRCSTRAPARRRALCSTRSGRASTATSGCTPRSSAPTTRPRSASTRRSSAPRAPATARRASAPSARTGSAAGRGWRARLAAEAARR